MTYRHVPGCTSMYLRYLKFDFLDIRPHPRISLALERYAVAVYSRRAALVYEKHSCLVNCMYLYVLVRTFQEILYWFSNWYVPVCAGMYRYVPVHTILPDPVQVYKMHPPGPNPFPKPKENVALNFGQPHRFGLAFQLQFSTHSPST